MGRPATGSPKWNTTKSVWEARITLPGGQRTSAAMAGIPPCAATPAGAPSSCACASCSQARRVAQLMSDQARRAQCVPIGTGEVANEWFQRYHAHEVELGQTDAGRKRNRWNKWIAPHIGHKPLDAVTRNDVEDIRDALDAAILAWGKLGKSRGRHGRELSGKAAMNVWSCLTSSFKMATSGKVRSLRVLADAPNPCANVQPPGNRESRRARRKTFLFPNEAATLLSSSIPLEWREVYALALYLYLRPGELRVLTWADVDLDRGVVSITKAWDDEAEATKLPKTLNGVRDVPLPASLRPLLERMRKGKAPTDLVVPTLGNAKEYDLAGSFRRHLVKAGVTRSVLHASTRTHVQANFRSCRDSGITWLAMSGLGVDKIMRRAGHDNVQTTLGYVKLAEDLTGQLGEPFGPLPQGLVQPVPGFGPVSAFWSENPQETADILWANRDLNQRTGG